MTSQVNSSRSRHRWWWQKKDRKCFWGAQVLYIRATPIHWGGSELLTACKPCGCTHTKHATARKTQLFLFIVNKTPWLFAAVFFLRQNKLRAAWLPPHQSSCHTAAANHVPITSQSHNPQRRKLHNLKSHDGSLSEVPVRRTSLQGLPAQCRFGVRPAL